MSDVPPDFFRVGDVITAKGPSVPREYWNRKMRVTSVDAVTGLPTLQLLPLDETPQQLAKRAKEAHRRARNSNSNTTGE